MVTTDPVAFRAFQAKLRADRARVEAALSALVQAGPRSLAFPDRRRPEERLFVHLDTYPGRLGCWRVTRLAPDAGELAPFGHFASTTFAAALREAWEHGADLSSPLERAP